MRTGSGWNRGARNGAGLRRAGLGWLVVAVVMVLGLTAVPVGASPTPSFGFHGNVVYFAGPNNTVYVLVTDASSSTGSVKDFTFFGLSGVQVTAAPPGCAPATGSLGVGFQCTNVGIAPGTTKSFTFVIGQGPYPRDAGCQLFGDSSDGLTATGPCSGPSCPTIGLSGALPGGTVGVPYTGTVNLGPTNSYTFSIVSGLLPPGLSLTPGPAGSAMLTGIPAAVGMSTFTVQAADSDNCSGQQQENVMIAPAPGGGGTTGVCDWTVAFLAPPALMRSIPQGYTVRVANAGTADCPPANLTIQADITAPLGGGAVSLSPSTIAIPGLPPGGKDVVTFTVDRIKFDPQGTSWFTNYQLAELSVSAQMPEDADMGRDEYDRTTTKFGYQFADFKPQPVGGLDAACPGGSAGACRYALDLFAHGSGSGATDATAAKPPLIGSAEGTVKRGKHGVIHYQLNKTGMKLLAKNHRLSITLVGTRTQGKLEAVIKGHLTLTH